MGGSLITGVYTIMAVSDVKTSCRISPPVTSANQIGSSGTRDRLMRSAKMKQQHDQQWRTILISSAPMVAMALALALQAAQVPMVYVVLPSIALSALLGLSVAADLVLARVTKRKR